jgi:hypothetical protein
MHAPTVVANRLTVTEKRSAFFFERKDSESSRSESSKGDLPMAELSTCEIY